MFKSWERLQDIKIFRDLLKELSTETWFGSFKRRIFPQVELLKTAWLVSGFSDLKLSGSAIRGKITQTWDTIEWNTYKFVWPKIFKTINVWGLKTLKMWSLCKTLKNMFSDFLERYWELKLSFTWLTYLHFYNVQR